MIGVPSSVVFVVFVTTDGTHETLRREHRIPFSLTNPVSRLKGVPFSILDIALAVSLVLRNYPCLVGFVSLLVAFTLTALLFFFR